MKYLIRYLIFIFLTVIACPANAQALPPQVGYSWWKIEKLKGAILVPDGWHKKTVDEKGRLGYFITKEKIEGKQSNFETGLSLNVLREFEKKKGKKPLHWASQFRDAAGNRGRIVSKWEKEMEPFKSLGFLFRSVVAGVDTTVHYLFVVNPKTGTLYYYSFESPTKNWEEAWKVGEPILKMLFMDDTT